MGLGDGDHGVCEKLLMPRWRGGRRIQMNQAQLGMGITHNDLVHCPEGVVWNGSGLVTTSNERPRHVFLSTLCELFVPRVTSSSGKMLHISTCRTEGGTRFLAKGRRMPPVQHSSTDRSSEK